MLPTHLKHLCLYFPARNDTLFNYKLCTNAYEGGCRYGTGRVCQNFNLSLVAEKPVWFTMKSCWVDFTWVHLSSNIERNQLLGSHEIRLEIKHEISSNAADEINLEDPY